MNKGSIVERLCSDLIAKSRDINALLYFFYDKNDTCHHLINKFVFISSKTKVWKRIWRVVVRGGFDP